MNPDLSQEVDIILTRPKNVFLPIFSWLIRLFTWSKSSHGLYFFKDDPIWDNRVFEIHFNNPRFINEGYLTRSVHILARYRLNITPRSYQMLKCRAVNWAKNETKGYFPRLIGVAIAKIGGKIFNTKFGNPIKLGHAQMCSEYIFKDLMMSIYMHPMVSTYWADRLRNSDTFTPKELEAFLDYCCDLQRKHSQGDLGVMSIKKII